MLPRAFGWTTQIDAGLARTLFSVTLHAIVYFWLMPAYIAFYTLAPASGRRTPLQRHDGAAHLHHVSCLLAAGRDAPSVRRPRARSGL